MNKRINWKITLLLIGGSIFILFPLYLTIVVAFKTPGEMTGNVLALPESWSLDNFLEAIKVTNFFGALGNSIFVTFFTVVLTLIIHSMIAYAIARNLHKKGYKFLYYYIISSMLDRKSVV